MSVKGCWISTSEVMSKRGGVVAFFAVGINAGVLSVIELGGPDVSRHDSAYNISPSLPLPSSVASGSARPASSKNSHPPPSVASTSAGPASSKNTPPPPGPSASDAAQNVARLHHACQCSFGPGNLNVLKFELLDEGVEKKQCILTITRPDGAVRSYKSNPIHRRKIDAKAEVASIAIQHGALDFISHGDSDVIKAKKGVLLAPLRDKQPIASTSHISSNPRGSTSFVAESGASMARYKEIEECCRAWRSLVRPEWFDFEDAKTWNNHGAVLRIQLTPHCYRVYSCEPTFDSPSKARENCADLAIGEGLDSSIRYDRQIGPAPAVQRALQAFYESLPRPFEEPFGDKTAAEINASGLLATALTLAKGARFIADFYFLVSTTDAIPPRTLQGCLLRLKRPGECRSFFADPQFSSQKEAKSAVALLALSQGAGKYIREAGAAVEAQVTPEIRRFVLASVFPVLATEMQRINGPGVAPQFEYCSADDAFGCRLQVNVEPKGEAVHQYAVPAQFRSKSDAKVAVAYLAAKQGVIDLLRFNGKPIPPGQAPAFNFDEGVPAFRKKPRAWKKKKKRDANEGGEDEGPPAKKQKTAPAAQESQPLHVKSAAQAVPKHVQRPPLSGGVLFGGPLLYPPGRDAAPVPLRAEAAQNAAPSSSHASGSGLRRQRSASLEDGEVYSD
ncbi:hypothetical protein DFH09DRAFT_1124997 [Mycena vulgaris]|nr:hypothetical protein DFH09DRAFT_1124997 [Mycena vulgaris]